MLTPMPSSQGCVVPEIAGGGPPRVVFLVNGLGMGNSTRCGSLVEALAEAGYVIDIVTSGNGVFYFKGRPDVAKLYEIEPLYYAKSHGKVSVLGTILALGDLSRVWLENQRRVGRILDERRPALVFTDSEYSLLPVLRRRIPCIALNNSDMVVELFARFHQKPLSILPQFLFVECLDFLFHSIVPDSVISPWIVPHISGRMGLKRVRPIVRRACLKIAPPRPDVECIVIMLSGSAFGSNLDPGEAALPQRIHVIGRAGTDAGAVRYHGKVRDNLALLADGDVFVINGGFSAVSEAIALGRPSVVIPVENHSEQYINARIVEELGLGRMATVEDWGAKLREVVGHYHEHRERFVDLGISCRGAEDAVRYVQRLAEDQREVPQGIGGTIAHRGLVYFSAQFLTYVVIALLAAASDFALFVQLYRLGVHYLAAQVAARILGGLVSFFLNNSISFSRQKKPGLPTQARRFLVLYVFSMLLSLSILAVLQQSEGLMLRRHLLAPEWAGRWIYVAKLAADGTCFVANFLVMKLYVFSNRFSLIAFVRSLFRISAAEEDSELGTVAGKSAPEGPAPSSSAADADAQTQHLR